MKFVIILIAYVLLLKINAQENNISEHEITNKLSFLKQNSKNREIIYKRKMFYDYTDVKNIDPVKIKKDSLRHFLVDHGFYDYNFEYFQFNLKNLEELNELYIKEKHPELNKLLSDTLYNKVTFHYRTKDGNLIIDVVISKSFIEFDDKKTINGAIGVGYYKEELIYKGTSKVKNIFYVKSNEYSDIYKKGSIPKQSINLNDNNKFSITVDVSSHKNIYTAIIDREGHILSLIKMY